MKPHNMSVSDTQTVQVITYNPQLSPFALSLPHPCSCKQAKEAIAKKLGLKPTSLDIFGLFRGGELGFPYKAIQEGANIPSSGGDLFFQRWCFNPERELKCIKSDDVAINLLYVEAKHRLDEGTIFPSPEQLQELEGLSDPFFPTEKQYLNLVRTVPGYSCCIAQPCRVEEDIVCNSCRIDRDSIVSCVMDMEHMSLKTNAQTKETLIQWPWAVVKRWKMIPSESLIKFEVCLQQGNASILSWVAFKTPQANVLFHSASVICDLIVGAVHNPSPKPAGPKLVGKGYDPLHEFINEKFFGTSPSFSALDSKKR